MPEVKIPPQEVLEANKQAFVHFTLHDFQVLVENRGVEFVMNAMDEVTYRKLQSYFNVNHLLR